MAEYWALYAKKLSSKPPVNQRVNRLAALGQVSANIAHEIRNPLGSISLNLQYLAQQSEVPKIYKTKLRNIESGVARIQSIVEGILEFIRPNPAHFAGVDIHRVIDSSIHFVRHEYEHSNLSIKKDYRARAPKTLIDSNQIIQVLVNLFLNAKDAMSTNGTLAVTTLSDSNTLEVHIQDDGIGISRQDLLRIFEPFFSTKRKGIGLGLAIVSRVIAEHGGQIAVESQTGIGTKFIIRLPRPGVKQGG